MILPRVGLFRSMPKGGVPKIHVVIVDGDICKSLCTRVVLRNGQMVTHADMVGVECLGCLAGDGRAGRPVPLHRRRLEFGKGAA